MNYQTFENVVSNAVLSYTNDKLVKEKKMGEAICAALYRVLAVIDGKYSVDKKMMNGQSLVPGAIVRKRTEIIPETEELQFFGMDGEIYLFNEVAAPKRYITSRNWVNITRDYKEKYGEEHGVVRTHFLNALIPFNLLKDNRIEREFRYIGYMDLNCRVIEFLSDQFNTLAHAYEIEPLTTETRPHEIRDGILDLSQSLLVRLSAISRELVMRLNISEI